MMADLHSDFEYSYYLYLLRESFRSSMIDCGVNALLKGIDGQNLALLASADYDDDKTLLETFKKASKEFGIKLPNKDEEDYWLHTKYFQFMYEGRTCHHFESRFLELPNNDEKFRLFTKYLKLIFEGKALPVRYYDEQLKINLLFIYYSLAKLPSDLNNGCLKDFTDWYGKYSEPREIPREMGGVGGVDYYH